MRVKVQLRDLTAEERIAIEKFTCSHTAAVCLIELTQIIRASIPGERPSQIAEGLQLMCMIVYHRVKRLKAERFAGLQDQQGSRRAATYPLDVVVTVMALH